jgi:uncharacterized membrane protein YcaP (DUF421 family)
LYRLVTWLTGRSKRFEEFIEGKPNVLSTKENFLQLSKKESLAQDEFFGTSYEINRAFRTSKNAFMETSGEVSVFYLKIMKSTRIANFTFFI